MKKIFKLVYFNFTLILKAKEIKGRHNHNLDAVQQLYVD